MVNKKAEGAPEGAAIPQKYLVKIPGVISTHTTSFSLQQAVAYALHQAFENRNEFLFEGKKFIGELGLQQLTSTILEDPKVFDFVQELPGLPSQPLSIPLPPAQPTLSAPAPAPAAPMPAPVASIDIDKLLVHAARYNIHPRQVADYVQRAANAYRLSGEDQDHLAHVLYNYKVGQSLPDLKVQGEEGKWLKKADEQMDMFPSMAPEPVVEQPLELSDMCDSYLVAALWSSNEDSGGGDTPMDENHSVDDVAEESKHKAANDCESFLAQAGDLLDRANEMVPNYDDKMAGYDFWLTRNGHGAGFQDRGLGDTGEHLAKIAEGFGEVYMYKGDDGKVYIS